MSGCSDGTQWKRVASPGDSRSTVFGGRQDPTAKMSGHSNTRIVER
jgi:hypothetical protein